jgi:secondary thiamine-phosphate synthase enzyme
VVKLHQEELRVRTQGKGFVNLTRSLQGIVARSQIATGLATVFVRHTSASLIIQENADPSVLRDLAAWMADLVPEDRDYEHAEEGPDDMPAHIRSAVTRSSESIPISDGKLCLGTWQAVYLWEHRDASHERCLIVQLVGA